jgi:hypothetical protein
MRNFLYTAGIFLLLLSPVTCNYDENNLLRTETDGILEDELPGGTTLSETTTNCEVDGDPIIKPKKP